MSISNRPTAAAASPARWGFRALAIATILVALGVSMLQFAAVSDVAANRIVFVGVVAVYATVGVLICERRRGNGVGPIILSIAAFMTLYLVLDVVILLTATTGGASIAAWLVSAMDGPWFVILSLLFLLFPDGRLPSPRWRGLLIVDMALAAVVFAWTAVKPGPLAYYPQFENPLARTDVSIDAIGQAAYMLLLLSVVLSAASLVGRWRRGDLVEHAQLKWIVAAAVVIAAVMGAYGVVIGAGKFDASFDLALGLALGFFPIAIGIAILRYHLFEIDRIVSRTIAYLLMTAVLVGAYAAAILVLQGPLGTFTGGETVAVALSTLVAAALFQPLRSRVQTVVDRRFDRARVDAEQTTIAFAERLRVEVDIEAVSTDLRETVRTAIKPTAVRLWLRGAG